MVSVKDAIKAAKDYVVDLYSDDEIKDVLLEEVQREGLDWLITIGFRDPSSNPFRNATPVDVDDDGNDLYRSADVEVPKERGFVRWPRVYKVVRIDGQSGRPVSITIRAA